MKWYHLFNCVCNVCCLLQEEVGEIYDQMPSDEQGTKLRVHCVVKFTRYLCNAAVLLRGSFTFEVYFS